MVLHSDADTDAALRCDCSRLFPGALVDPIAYAPLLRAAANAGFPAYLVEIPRRGALGGADDPELATRFDRLLGAPVLHARG